MKTMQELDVLTADDVAELLDCGPDQVNLLASTRKLPGLKFGRGWVFPAGALYHVLNSLALTNMAIQGEHPASEARAAVRPVGVELRPRNQRQTPPVLGLVPPSETPKELA